MYKLVNQQIRVDRILFSNTRNQDTLWILQRKVLLLKFI